MKIFSTLQKLFLEIIFPSPFMNKNISYIPTAPENKLADVFSLFDYQHPQGKEIIYHIKKFQDRYIQEEIAEHMREHVLEYIGEQQLFGYFISPIVTTVPLTKKSKKIRNFNQCENIARFFARNISGTYKEIFLKTKETQKQALIRSRSKRKLNIKNSFQIINNMNIEHQDVIIIDDLVTTGATIAELFNIARKNKVRNIIAITVAH